jgi:hypothetical protein
MNTPSSSDIQTRPSSPPLSPPALSPVPAAPASPSPGSKPAIASRPWGWDAVALLVVVSFAVSFVVVIYFCGQPAKAPAGDASAPGPQPGAQEKRQPRQMTDFTCRVDQGVRQQWAASDAVSIRYNGDEELHGCQVTVQAWYEDKQSFYFDRLWAVWVPGETKSLSFAWRGASVEYVRISGTAQVNGEAVHIDKTWEARRLGN